ncbi:MAG TPA: HoxN/HupN/NixA family nickel/cobalt transporter [Thermomicrobiales bacterium]|nr:HoxN/HupN/NixA family nickel/cobalt transporter [Thermomicrobiales bacterium]
MGTFFGHIFNDQSQAVKGKVIGLYVVLAVANIGLWALTLAVSTRYAVVLGTALLAYTFGLRHGVDADHIAAVDNVTRKLLQDGKRPVGVGFFFSLGHSSVVVLLSIVVAIAAGVVQRDLPAMQGIGGVIGTSVSAIFLYVIGVINLLVFIDVFRMFRRVAKGGTYSEETLEEFLAQRGLMNRFFRPLMRLIDTSWKMYPLGFLFGLGFDTASEVALLGISAASASTGMPVVIVLLFPFLFAAGMSLVDTTDSIMMLGAYGWAFVKPVRKLYYNMNITLVSVLIALVVGTVEVLSVVAGQLSLSGPFWVWVSNLDFEVLGYLIIGIFVVSWVGSFVIYKINRYDHIEATPAD